MFSEMNEVDEQQARQAYKTGIDLMQEEKLQEAVEQFRTASGHFEVAAAANYNMACCWALIGDKEKAFSAPEFGSR